MNEKLCIRCYVRGKVQGVWFRASTQEKAQELGITGFAKNLPDGRVEVLACGEEKDLKSLFNWLHKGPSGATVDDVTKEELEYRPIDDFKTY